jgi:hypothetical protein
MFPGRAGIIDHEMVVISTPDANDGTIEIQLPGFLSVFLYEQLDSQQLTPCAGASSVPAI